MEHYDRETELAEVRQEAYREAAERGMRSINVIMAHMGGRLLDPKATMKDVTIDFWSLCYALGSYLCEGVSMTARAEMIGISKATLSKNAVELCIGNDWPPSLFMRDPETIKAYVEARTRAIEKENKKHE